MKMTGFFCQDDYSSKLSKLTNEEVGRLFRALMAYHATGEIADLEIRESIAFDFIKEDIDKAEEAYRKKCEQASANRRKGLNQPSTDDNGRQRASTGDNESHHVNKCKDNEKLSSFMDDTEAAAIQNEHNRIFDAAEDAGFKMSNTVRARLISLYADNGLEKMLNGFNECATHGAPTIAYLEAVLKGTGKKKPQMKVLPAQQYDQRDYSGVQAELMRQQDREIEEALTKKYGSSNPEDWRKGVNAELQAEQDREMEEYMKKESG
jgi:hypothetical protein